MKKFILTTLLIIVVIITALVLVKDVVAKAAIENGVRLVTGLQLKMDRFALRLTRTDLDIEKLQILNPEGFTDKVMLDMPRIFVDFSVRALMQGKVHLQSLDIQLNEFVVAKNKDGVLNLDTLKALQPQPKEGEAEKPAPEKKPAKAPEIQIDLFHLKIGKVFYKDYSGGGEPSVKEFAINIDESFKNITAPEQIVKLIVIKALMNTSIASLTNLDLGSLQGTVTDVLSSSSQMVDQVAGKAQDAVMKAAAGVDAGKMVSGAEDSLKDATGAASEKAGELAGGLKDAAGSLKTKVKLPFGKNE